MHKDDKITNAENTEETRIKQKKNDRETRKFTALYV